MNQKERDLKYISFLLGSWIAAIRLENAINYFDINRISQGVAQKLLNLIYNYELEDLDAVQKNYPGLDLGELQKSGVAFQVTSRADTDKIISTLEKVKSHQLNAKFPGGIKFLILREGERIKFGKKTNPQDHLATFEPSNDIIYPETLTVEISKIYDADDYVTILKIKELVQKHIKPNLEPANEPSEDRLNAIVGALEKKLEQMQSQPQVRTSLIRGDETRFPSMITRSQRPELVAEYLTLLKTSRILWMTGANSVGKSSLANLLGKSYNQEKLWIDFRGTGQDRLLTYLITGIAGKLNLAATSSLEAITTEIVSGFEKKPVLIFNDLPSLAAMAEPDQRDLTGFIQELAGNDFIILVTSNHQIPPALEDELGDKLCCKAIPMFNEQETTEVVISYGAPDPLEDHVAGMITALSEGHPLIINAICKFLKERDWDLSDENIDKIFKGDYSHNLNKQTYDRILTTTTDEQAIELLYRLKEVTGNISDREIQALASACEPVAYPQHKILSLSEIWLQPIEAGVYQLSPLVKSLSSNMDTKKIEQLNLALAEAIFSSGKITSTEALRGIMYFIKGKGFLQAALKMVSILQETMVNPKFFFASGFNLIWYNSPIPTQVPVSLRLYLRSLQIQLTQLQEKNIDYLYTDFEKLGRSHGLDEMSLGLYHFTSYRIKLANGSIDAITHLLEAEKLLPDVVHFQDKESDGPTFANAFWLTFASLKEPQDYQKWFDKFDELGLDKNSYDPSTNFAYISGGLSLSISLPTLQQNIGNENTLELLNGVVEHAQKRNLELLAAYAIKNIVAVLGSMDQLRQAETFITGHQSLLSNHPIYQVLVIGELGHQYYLSGQKEQSLRQLQQVIDIEIPDFFTERIEFLKDYAKATADLKEANRLFIQALEIVQRASSYYKPQEQLALYGEIGISYMNLRDYKQSIQVLEKGYDILYHAYEDTDDYKCLVIRYGHTANYVSQFVVDDYASYKALGEDYVVPIQGFFYFTNEALIKSGFYFEERRYLNALVFKTSFEYLGNYEIARKWAIESLQVIVNVPEPKFAVVLNTCLFYLIKDRAFQKALNVYLYIKNRRKLEASGAFENDLAKASNQAIGVDDVVFYEHLMIPILYVQSLDLLTEKITPESLYLQLEQIFTRKDITFNDTVTKDFMLDIFSQILVQKIAPHTVYDQIAQYKGEYTGQILTMGYILLSCFTDARDSAFMHLSLASRIESMNKHPFIGYYNFVVFPYYEEFWIEKSHRYFHQFIEQDQWSEKGVPYFKNATGLSKFKKLFQTLVYHLDINVATSLENWLSN